MYKSLQCCKNTDKPYAVTLYFSEVEQETLLSYNVKNVSENLKHKSYSKFREYNSLATWQKSSEYDNEKRLYRKFTFHIIM